MVSKGLYASPAVTIGPLPAQIAPTATAIERTPAEPRHALLAATTTYMDAGLRDQELGEDVGGEFEIGQGLSRPSRAGPPLLIGAFAETAWTAVGMAQMPGVDVGGV